jgi:hypothetical protein
MPSAKQDDLDQACQADAQATPSCTGTPPLERRRKRLGPRSSPCECDVKICPTSRSETITARSLRCSTKWSRLGHSGLRRSRLLLMLKRKLANHALAEEDVVYHIVNRSAQSDRSKHFHDKHAGMEVLLLRIGEPAQEWRGLERHCRRLQCVDPPACG